MLRVAAGCSRLLRPAWALQAGLQPAWEALQGMTSVGISSGGSAAPAGSGGGSAAAAAATSGSSSASGDPTSPDRVAKVLAHAFHKAPKETATALLQQLSDLDRIQLVLALQRHTKEVKLQRDEQAYIDDLVKKVHVHKQHSKLTKQQIHNAVLYQRMLGKFSHVSEDAPSRRQLTAVAFASGFPFIFFGLLDNAIMLVAGEQIDYLFGAKFGLSVLASAGLGNLVADVVGVSATHTIQENIKRIGFAQPPRLSLLQQQMTAVRWAQLGGAALGVAAGCLLGMTPLLFMEPGFFVSAADAAASAADAAASAAAALGAAAGGGGGEPAAAETAAAVAATAAALAVEAGPAEAAAAGRSS
ncbi:hypothetical protein ABPG75_008881 [Micractinium tetrahymenae]